MDCTDSLPLRGAYPSHNKKAVLAHATRLSLIVDVSATPEIQAVFIHMNCHQYLTAISRYYRM